MKSFKTKFILLMGVLMLNCTSFADPIPRPLQKDLKFFSTTSITLENSVLRIVMDRPVVNFDIYQTVITKGACYPLWVEGKRGWGKATIERVEVMNKIQGQGFAFVGGRKACEELGSSKNENSYLNLHTWVCVAGMSCRPRRDGEITSGDE